jgi:hypothetical protein
MGSRSTSGLHQGSVAAEVNGEQVALSDFNRAYLQRIEFFKQFSGGKLSPEQEEGIKSVVLRESIERKLLVQDARAAGVQVSDQEVLEKIAEVEAFQKDGRFDPVGYKRVLEANSLTPFRYEEMVRQDLILSHYLSRVRDSIHFTEAQLLEEFLSEGSLRSLKFVVLTNDHAKKTMKIEESRLQAALQNPEKLKEAESRFEAMKETRYAGKKFQDVSKEMIREMLLSEDATQVGQAREELAKRVAGLLKVSDSQDSSLKAFLKTYGVEIQKSEKLKRDASYVPGLMDPKPLLAEAFRKDTDLAKNPKVFSLAGQSVIAVVTASEDAKESDFPAKRGEIYRRLVSQREQALTESWMESAMKAAKISVNASVVGDQAAAQYDRKARSSKFSK